MAVFHRKKFIYIGIIVAVLVLILGFIWGNSMLSGGLSNKISSTVTAISQKFLSPIYELFTGKPASEPVIHSLVRKAAHFLEFAVIAVVAFLLLLRLRANHPIQNMIFVLFGSLLIAVIDEYIQAFSPGRSSSVRDVMIDFLGAVTGALLTLMFVLIIKKIKNKKQPQGV